MASQKDFVTEIRDAVLGLYQGLGEFMPGHGMSATEGSKAAAEQSNQKWSQSVFNAASIGIQLIESGGDHLSVFAKTITEPVEAIACWTCVRSMLEPCALAAWLLDPEIDASDRAARVFALRYEGCDQQAKFSRAAGHPRVVIEDIQDQIEELEEQAAELGFARMRNNKNERHAIAAIMPGATHVIQTELNLGTAYRLLSAVTHGHHWAMLQLGFEAHEEGTPLVTDTGVRIRILRKRLNAPGVGYLAATACNALEKAVTRQFRYMGWDLPGVISLFNGASSKLDRATRLLERPN